MAIFLFTHYFGSPWDEIEDNDIFDVISGGYQVIKEVFQHVQQWISGEELDATEIAEVTQSFALRLLVFTYQSISWVIQYTCALLIYIFTDADTMKQAIEYVRPSKGSMVYKSLTSLIVYEKPISFDFNPIHWVIKITRVFFLGPLSKPTRDSFFTSGKVLWLLLIPFLIYRSISKKKVDFICQSHLFSRYPPSQGSNAGCSTEDGASDQETSAATGPSKYEGLIKWEAGLVKCSSDRQNDHLSLKISVNSNICSDNPPVRYDEIIASSTASICKIVSDILTNCPLGSQEITFERSENSSPRPNEEEEKGHIGTEHP